MRALVLGLVGVVIAAGAAEAKACEATFTLVSSENPAFPPRQALVGSVVAEIRHADGPKGTAIEVIGKPGRFIVVFNVSRHSTPAAMGYSSMSAGGYKVQWNGKDPSYDVFSADIFDGPLSGLRLERRPCD